MFIHVLILMYQNFKSASIIHPEIRRFLWRYFFWFFSFLRKIFRQYNSRTIRHIDFRFKTLNRSCYHLPQVNIWFYVLRTKAVKRPKNFQHIRHYKSRTIRCRDFWFETLIGPNTVYLRYISDFKFYAQKRIRGQKTANHIRHYTSKTTHHSDVQLKHYISLITVYPKYILVVMHQKACPNSKAKKYYLGHISSTSGKFRI